MLGDDALDIFDADAARFPGIDEMAEQFVDPLDRKLRLEGAAEEAD